MKIYTNKFGHMTKMVAMPIYGKNFLKSSPPELMEGLPWNLICSIGYPSTTNIVQIVTLG